MILEMSLLSSEVNNGQSGCMKLNEHNFCELTILVEESIITMTQTA